MCSDVFAGFFLDSFKWFSAIAAFVFNPSFPSLFVWDFALQSRVEILKPSVQRLKTPRIFNKIPRQEV